MRSRFLKHPIVRTVNYLIPREFPGCKVSFKETDDGIKTIVFSFSEEDRKKYRLARLHEEFQILNNRLTGTNLLNPFTYDPLVQRIEEIEVSMEVEKQRKLSVNTRRVLSAAERFIETSDILIKQDETKLYLSFLLNDERRFYVYDKDNNGSHLNKTDETDISEYRTYKMNMLPVPLIYAILHTAFPGLKKGAAEYLSGNFEGKEAWRQSEDAYAKEYQKKIYRLFGIKPLDILYDAYDGIQVGEYTENKMRHIVLLDGSEYAYRTEFDWIGNEVLKKIPYDEYIADRNRILLQYKSQVMEVFRNTGTVPMVAIELMNLKENSNDGYLLMSVEDAIKKIRRIKLQNPLFDIEKKLEKLIETHHKQNSVSVTIRNNKDNPYIKNVLINEKGRTVRMDIDLRDCSVSDLYARTVVDSKTPVSNRKKFADILSDALKEELPKLKEGIEYKHFLLGEKLREKGILFEKVDDEETAAQYRMKEHSVLINPYDNTISVLAGMISDETEKLQYEEIKTLCAEMFK